MSLQNADECLEAWQHLKSYAESLDKDSKTLSKLQGIHSVPFFGRDLVALQSHLSHPFGHNLLIAVSQLVPTLLRIAGILGAIHKHFSSPPASVLESWDPVKLLDTLPWDKADVYSSTNTDLVEQLLQTPADLADAVRGTEILPQEMSYFRL